MKTKTIAMLLSVVGLTGGVASAQNLLLNGDFNTADLLVPTAPANWTPFTAPGNSWASHETKPGSDGLCLVVGNGWYEGKGSFSQTVAATEGLNYQLDVLSGADTWWQPTGTMTMFFLDSSALTLGIATRNTVDPAEYGAQNDIPHPWASYTLTGEAPAGTTSITVEFASAMPPGTGGSIWFENASLTVVAVPEPGSAALIALGAVALIGYRSRRNSTRA